MDSPQFAALTILLDYFEAEKLPYHITGGLAGNIYGSTWKLHDIDIEMHLRDLFAVEQDFADAVSSPTGRYNDEEFDIWLLQLRINGVAIDLNAVEDFYIKTNESKEYCRIETTLNDAVQQNFGGRQVFVQPLADLIRYKTLLNRKNDLRELTSIARTDRE